MPKIGSQMKMNWRKKMDGVDSTFHIFDIAYRCVHVRKRHVRNECGLFVRSVCALKLYRLIIRFVERTGMHKLIDASMWTHTCMDEWHHNFRWNILLSHEDSADEAWNKWLVALGRGSIRQTDDLWTRSKIQRYGTVRENKEKSNGARQPQISPGSIQQMREKTRR